ncbi:hypothetical protein GSI_01192 [Ganoderma sinense ZZ0214-1]|uniref:ubiquitinyl hydrolase 1 n=1 Tax=Ganoderma sinense ZZ0214-1 TaxID=1077348 RepID=A0A2G8SV86_9APHY|nr:hypothetical protein GSI_01192 [Ganoderma sinense ZZ0214-1]
MNSTLQVRYFHPHFIHTLTPVFPAQAMASLAYLQPQLEKIHARAEALDVPTPVIDNLRDLLSTTLHSHPRPLRPLDIIGALSNHSPGKHNSLFSSREHQDAQELFQLLSECVKTESTAVAREIRRDRGLGGLTQKDDRTSRDLSQTVFDGLTANRRSCVECGYTEAVMHFPFDNWQLAVPRLVAACRLEDCLDDYTRLELLNDCICRKCSMLATYKRLEREASRTTEAAAATHDPTSSKKKRARDSRKLLARVKAALDEGRIEEDIKGVKLEKVFSRASTKQSMIARPPPVLALHLNRSMHYGSYAAKTLPRCLPRDPRSHAVHNLRSALHSALCPHLRPAAPDPHPTFRDADAFHLRSAPHALPPLRRRPGRQPPVTAATPRHERKPGKAGTGRGWLRISDDSVQECGIERVLQEGAGAFMLYYERVQQPRSPVYHAAPPRASQETIRPEDTHSAAPALVPAMPVPSALEADGKAVAVAGGKEHGHVGSGGVIRADAVVSVSSRGVFEGVSVSWRLFATEILNGKDVVLAGGLFGNGVVGEAVSRRRHSEADVYSTVDIKYISFARIGLENGLAACTSNTGHSARNHVLSTGRYAFKNPVHLEQAASPECDALRVGAGPVGGCSAAEDGTGTVDRVQPAGLP